MRRNIPIDITNALEVNGQDIDRAVAVLRLGGVVAYPADTVWGIGCDAADSSAVRRVYTVKQRDDSKALITLVSDWPMLGRYVHIEPAARQAVIELMARAGRPVTVVYPEATGVAPELLAPDGSLGVRIVGQGYAAALCRALDGAIVSTSANVSGHPTPATYAGIEPALLRQLDYVAAAGRGVVAVTGTRPSMVVRLGHDGTMTVLRE